MHTSMPNQPIIKKFKFSLTGLPVPKQTPAESGIVGKHVEKLVSNRGIPVRNGTVDIPKYQLEIKTRNKDSHAAHTVGTMTLDDILITKYDSSPIRKKMQYQYRVEYDNVLNIITDDKIYDFTSDYIQNKVKSAYVAGQVALYNHVNLNIKPPLSVYGNQYGHFEKRQKNQYAFRIPDVVMRSFLNTSMSNKTSISILDIEGEILLTPLVKVKLSVVDNSLLDLEVGCLKEKAAKKKETSIAVNLWDQYV